MEDVRQLLETTLHMLVVAARVHDIEERDGPQGYSGAQVRYFDLRYTDEATGAEGTQTLLIKQAELLERRVYTLFTEAHQRQVPVAYAADLESDGPAPLCLQYVGDQRPEDLALRSAPALADLHLRHRGQRPDWLPRADRAFLEHIIQTCWRRPWQCTLTGEAFTDDYGNAWDASIAEEDFATEYGHYTEQLEHAAAALITDMERLWEQGDSLTLIHADLHSDHALIHNGQPYFIDWGEAHYGPLYLDLPNFLSREQALVYHAALAAGGYEVPIEEFLDNYRAASRYFAIKYFSFGLWSWRANDPNRRQGMKYWLDAFLLHLETEG